jgi:hypothetical protein
MGRATPRASVAFRSSPLSECSANGPKGTSRPPARRRGSARRWSAWRPRRTFRCARNRAPLRQNAARRAASAEVGTCPSWGLREAQVRLGRVGGDPCVSRENERSRAGVQQRRDHPGRHRPRSGGPRGWTQPFLRTERISDPRSASVLDYVHRIEVIRWCCLPFGGNPEAPLSGGAGGRPVCEDRPSEPGVPGTSGRGVRDRLRRGRSRRCAHAPGGSIVGAPAQGALGRHGSRARPAIR